MKSIVTLNFTLICLLVIIGCGNNQDNMNFSESIPTPDHILIKFGDGNKLLLDDKQQIKYIIDTIRYLNYKPIKIPETVGHNFSFEVEPEMKYFSTGYLQINGRFYEVGEEDESHVINIDKYILNIGNQQISGLLGNKQDG